MKVLMIDVGGTNVKLMASGHEGFRKVPSGSRLTASQMVKEVLKATADWEFEAVTLGFPGLVADGKIVREPLNLGGGWINFDYKKAFKRPVRFINDAAMQALATYEAGRMLFVGFGTSTGATIVVDDVIVPLEIGMLCLPDGKRFIDRLTDEAKKKRGKKKWLRSVHPAIDMLRDVFKPDDIVIGGGNAKDIEPLPPGCRVQSNQGAFRGACRLWPGADMFAEPYGTSWRIKKRRPAPKRKKTAKK
jgi:predicted NBD/HSP70 family sugar kinase